MPEAPLVESGRRCIGLYSPSSHNCPGERHDSAATALFQGGTHSQADPMSQKQRHRQGPGPFLAEHLRSGDPYELADGHPVECLPGGGRHSRANLTGGLALGTDPGVDEAGVDTGYTPDPKNLRAPDIAVGNVPDRPGWVEGAPPLAVEYADTGQDEQDLRDKVATLLAAGTRYVWVVRMVGPRRVEVHEPGKASRELYPGDRLEAPGILRNALPVDALYDPDTARETALRNLLQRHGYADLDAVRSEGRNEGLSEGRSEGELDLVLRLLGRKLDGLTPQQERWVRALAPTRIGQLAEALLDFASRDDLDRWITQEDRSDD